MSKMKQFLKNTTAVCFIIALFFCISCSETANSDENILTDIDGSVYTTVKIGKQIWMAENLDVNHFSNGDPIKEARTDEEWERAGKTGIPAWCYYDNNSKNGIKYGKLYNWHAVNDPRGLAPEGWHIPSYNEWSILTDYLGGDGIAWKRMGLNLEFEGRTKNSESGFDGLLGGLRYAWSEFDMINQGNVWWTSTLRSEDIAEAREVVIIDEDLSFISKSGIHKNAGAYVRCIRNSNEYYIVLGDEKFEESNFSEAKVYYTKTIKLMPNNSEAYQKRGNANYKLENFHEAIMDFTNAIEIDPKYEEAIIMRGQAKAGLDDFVGAIADYNMAIEINPNNEENYVNRAIALSYLGNSRLALLDCNLALEINPNNPMSYIIRGFIKLDLNDMNGACLDFSKAGEMGEVMAYEYIREYFN